MNKKVQIKLWHLVGIVVVLILVVYFTTINITPTQPSDYSSQKSKIDSLKLVINDLDTLITNKNDTIKQYEYNIYSLNSEINKIDEEIDNIRNEYAEKINLIDNYSHSELTQFFTDRYK